MSSNTGDFVDAAIQCRGGNTDSIPAVPQRRENNVNTTSLSQPKGWQLI